MKIQGQSGDLQWTVDAVYNLLMSDIEPELRTDFIDQLETLYQGESEAERTARHERYAQAFTIFLQRFAAFVSAYKDKVKSIQEQAEAILGFDSNSTDISTTAA